MHVALGQFRGAARALSCADASARRGSSLAAPRSCCCCCCCCFSGGIARPLRRRCSSSSSTFSTQTSLHHRRHQPLLLAPPPRSSFSRIPIESLDYDRVSDNELRRRRRARRRKHHHNHDDGNDDDDVDDDDVGDDGDDGEDFGDGEGKRGRGYSDDSFNDDEDASGLAPGFPAAGTAAASSLPGSQVARLKDLASQSSARRDFHWRAFKAHSAKSNMLSAIVLACTTAGGTSGLISLTQAVNSSPVVPAGGGFSGLVPDAAAFHGMTSAAAQAAREAAAASAAAAAATAAANASANANSGSSHVAALLSPVLGYAATLVSGLQNYSKPSTVASRHLTAYKRYQVISRHCRDALRYGSVRSYARVIQAVERKMDQYEDESPTLPWDLEPDVEGNLPKPPGAVEAFFAAMMEVPE